MTPERWKQLRSVFDQVVEHPAEERPAFLAAACGSDMALRREVEEMLAEDPESDANLRNAIAGAAADAVEGQRHKMLGSQVGPYRITGILGHGGMGTVYLGERADRQFKQRVAIKLVEQMAVHPQLKTRLRSERQILANLEHPYIARLIDGGETKEGIPYLVIEYIEGQTIEEYCDDHRLSVQQRLVLFEKVCSAVDYAHRNLIVHRDLKPANILVTADGTPKLLDFGIAKILSPETVGATVAVTRMQDRLLTPEHASPEQVLGQIITTATDIYSLGVLLYHLLCRRSPYADRNSTSQGLQRAICNEDPPRPSSLFRVTKNKAETNDSFDSEAVALKFGVTAQRLRRQLSGDIDEVILKAMRKERAARYATAEQIAEDLRRHRAGQPVLALQGGRRYRVAKFLKRNKLGAGLAAVILLSLIGFSGLMWIHAQRMTEQRDVASHAKERAEQVAAFMVDIFSAADPYKAQGHEATAKELLERGAQRIQNELIQQPELRAQMLESIGYAYQQQGLPDRAIPLLEQALQIRRQFGDKPNALLATCMTNLATALRSAGQNTVAEGYYRQALAMNKKLFGEDHERVAQVMVELAYLLLEGHSNLGEAEQLFKRSLVIYRTRLGEDRSEVASTLLALGNLMLWKNNLPAAEEYQREALRIRQAKLPRTHPDFVATLASLGVTLSKRGKLDEAERLLTEALELQRTVFGPQSTRVASALSALSSLYEQRKQYPNAIRLLEEALGIIRQAHGPDYWETGYYLDSLGALYFKLKRYPQARSSLEAALLIFKETLPEDHLYIASSEHTLGEVLLATNKLAEAEEPLRAAIAICTKLSGADSWRTARSENTLGVVLSRTGNPEEGGRLLTDSYKTLRTQLSDSHELTQLARERLNAFQKKYPNAAKTADPQNNQNDTASLLADIFLSADPFRNQVNTASTRKLLDSSAERLRKDQSLLPAERAKVLDSLGFAYKQQNAPKQAIPLLQEALKILQDINTEPNVPLAGTLLHLASALRMAGKTSAAESYYNQALSMNRRLFGDNDEHVAKVMVELGGLQLEGRSDIKATEQLLNKALEIYQTRLELDHPDKIEVLLHLASLMIWKDDLTGAERYQREALRICKKKLPRAHPDCATALGSLGFTLLKKGQLGEAEQLLSESLELQRKVFGPKNPQITRAIDALALIKDKQHATGEAIRLVQEAIDIQLEAYGLQHHMTGYYYDSLAKLYFKSGRSEQAESAIRKALDIYRQTLSPDHLFTASSQHTLGEILLGKGDLTSAEKLLRAAIATCIKATGPTSWRTARSENTLGAVLAKAGRTAEAEKLLTASYQTLRTTLGDNDDLTQLAAERLALSQQQRPRPNQAASAASL